MSETTWEERFNRMVNDTMVYPDFLRGKGVMPLEGYDTIRNFIRAEKEKSYQEGYETGSKERGKMESRTKGILLDDVKKARQEGLEKAKEVLAAEIKRHELGPALALSEALEKIQELIDKG